MTVRKTLMTIKDKAGSQNAEMNCKNRKIQKNSMMKASASTAAMICGMMIAFICAGMPVQADDGLTPYKNPDTGYSVYFQDEASLLSDSEKEQLISDMKPVTEYCNAGFVTTDNNDSGDAAQYAEDFFNSSIGYAENGTVFLIDMDTRNIQIHSEGYAWNVLGRGYANTITDNVYTYASDQDYYGCASTAFAQIYSVMSGAKISQPMRYISAALLAVILALIFNYFVVLVYSGRGKASESEIVGSIVSHCNISHQNVVFTHQTKVYDPPESSSSGGGGGSCGGGGGGGSCGGGGGHSF